MTSFKTYSTNAGPAVASLPTATDTGLREAEGVHQLTFLFGRGLTLLLGSAGSKKKPTPPERCHCIEASAKIIDAFINRICI